MEVGIDVWRWQYLAQKTFFGLVEEFKRMTLDCAFAIEAREEEEMPECLLGCVRLERPNGEKFESS